MGKRRLRQGPVLSQGIPHGEDRPALIRQIEDGACPRLAVPAEQAQRRFPAAGELAGHPRPAIGVPAFPFSRATATRFARISSGTSPNRIRPREKRQRTTTPTAPARLVIRNSRTCFSSCRSRSSPSSTTSSTRFSSIGCSFSFPLFRLFFFRLHLNPAFHFFRIPFPCPPSHRCRLPWRLP